MKAIITQNEKFGDRKLCVFLSGEGETPYGKIVDVLYYTNIDEIDISALWNEWKSNEQIEFQKDFLMQLRSYSKGFVIPKACVNLKSLLDSWAEELQFESVELPEKKQFNPNDFVYAWRFKG